MGLEEAGRKIQQRKSWYEKLKEKYELCRSNQLCSGGRWPFNEDTKGKKESARKSVRECPGERSETQSPAALRIEERPVYEKSQLEEAQSKAAKTVARQL